MTIYRFYNEKVDDYDRYDFSYKAGVSFAEHLKNCQACAELAKKGGSKP